ncbi:MAG: serine hydrolase [Bradyrhizobium sp.]|uniref:serine hydrolase domain-containing protein n=1 Tax=Bradyrhizobium sp. TaxID=376 RepID=UPI0025BAFAEE|nr:serine hydrolase [Bradyrhizobium sp.]MBI5264121.1 serine hydrolase [Bradyrhizobium sp.]
MTREETNEASGRGVAGAARWVQATRAFASRHLDMRPSKGLTRGGIVTELLERRLSRRRFLARSTAAATGAAALITGCTSGGEKNPGTSAGTSGGGTAPPSPQATASGQAAAPALTTENFERAHQYSVARGGLGMLVMKGADLLFERYATAEQVHRLASGTKSFSGAIAVAAIEDGVLHGFDELVSDTITEWQHDAAAPGKKDITTRQLLSLTSGLEPATSLLQGERTRDNRYRAALGVELTMNPGTAFMYGPSHFYVFGELMRRKLQSRNETPLDYLTRRVLDPIGLRIAQWSKDEAGNPHMPAGAYLAAREWAKYGRLIKQRGMWQGKKILDSAILAECSRGSAVNPGYGLTFWLGLPITPKIVTTCSAPPRDAAFPSDLVEAAGHGKQRLYIIPSLDLVVVHQAESATFRDREFLSLLLGAEPPVAGTAVDGQSD